MSTARVTPADIEQNIAGEYYFTALDALHALGEVVSTEHLDALRVKTICVLALKNGYTLVGTSACVDPANFDAELGRTIARKKASEQLWPLMGYALKERVAAGE